jgi:hypothetical protein
MRLVEQTGETLVAVARAVGDAFAPVLVPLLPLVQGYVVPAKSVSERSMAGGLLAEVLETQTTSFVPHLDAVLGILRIALVDPEPEVVSNAAFTLGIICQQAGPAVYPAYPTIMQLLYAHGLTADRLRVRIFYSVHHSAVTSCHVFIDAGV